MLHTKNRKHRGSSKESIIQVSESSQYNKYQRHYEIKNISSVSFQPVSIDKVKDIIKTLNTRKACPDGDVPVKLIIIKEDIFSTLIFQNFNQSLVNGEFPHCLKQAEVIPVFKNKEKLDRSNNRPVNLLPVISKIYERLMYDQMFNVLIKLFLNFNVVFVKDLTLRNCILYMIKIAKNLYIKRVIMVLCQLICQKHLIAWCKTCQQ